MLALTFAIAIASASQCSFRKTGNAAISGHNTEVIAGDSDLSESKNVVRCQEACCSRSWCKSFDITRASGKCHLSNKKETEVGGLTNYASYDYYEIQPVCVPFSQEACRNAANKAGLTLGTPFLVDSLGAPGYPVQGCYKKDGVVRYASAYPGTFSQWADMNGYYIGTEYSTKYSDDQYDRIIGADCRDSSADYENPYDNTCLPYSQKTCKATAKELGYDVGGYVGSTNWPFWGFKNDYVDGCYAYPDDSASYVHGYAFYGRGQQPRDEFWTGALNFNENMSNNNQVRLNADCSLTQGTNRRRN